MRTFIKRFFLLLPITSLLSLHALSPYFGIRSQGLNGARDLAGEANFINLDKECTYGTVWGLFEYTHSFRPNVITNCLFGSDVIQESCSCDPAIVISGSQTANRAPTDWLADYFGLPTDFKSVVTFRPIVQNFIIDLNFYIGLDEWCKGLYFQVNAPITHTKWDLDYNETVSLIGNNPSFPGYYGEAQVGIANLLSNFTEFATGDFVPTFSSATGTSVGFDNLANAKMRQGPVVKTGLADLRFMLGWNIATQNLHAGFNIRFAAPAGSKPEGEFLFEPTVGNGHHWEFGGGISTHYTFWRSEDDEDHLGIYLDADITHLFKARQHRTFDLKNKPNSRYMLAEKLTTVTQPVPPATTPLLLANPPFPNIAFANEFSPVANLTTMDVDVSMAAQGEIIAMLNYTRGAFSLDVGYNLWAISCEKISQAGCPSPLDDGATWALKGDAFVIGFEDDSATTALFAPVRLAATESLATINAGTNFPAAGTTNPATIIEGVANPNIDSPMLAVANDGNLVGFAPQPIGSTLAAPFAPQVNPQTHSSLDPVFLSIADVDFAGNKGLSNKIFMHLSYTWLERDEWTPYLGIGAEGEFGSSSCNTSCNTSCSTANSCDMSSTSSLCSSSPSCTSCSNCTLSQWGVWIKGGVTF